MNIRLLIVSIMQQTTVLIGQLSTAAGVRAARARDADRVVLDLARELDVEGAAHRVAGDMVGLALRSYQKKARRLTASASDPEHTLWEAILAYIGKNQRVHRSDLFARFGRDGE